MSIFGGISALILLILTIVLGAVRGQAGGADVFSLAVIPFSLALLFSLSSLVYGVLRTSAAQEEEEKQLLEKRRDVSALDVEEDVRFTAGRSFENYRRFAPYVLALLGALMMALFLIYFSRNWVARAEAVTPGDCFWERAQCGVAFRDHDAAECIFRRLFRRAVAGAFVSLASTGRRMAGDRICGDVRFDDHRAVRHNNHLEVDAYAARVIFWIFAVLGVEFITNFIIEFYRPRTMREARPIFESRLLALFTEPGGVMRNIASALDYQFGFQVPEPGFTASWSARSSPC